MNQNEFVTLTFFVKKLLKDANIYSNIIFDATFKIY